MCDSNDEAPLADDIEPEPPDLEDFEYEFAEVTSKCPRCGGKLVLRHGRYGEFYGCSRYPGCKFTIDKSMVRLPPEQTENPRPRTTYNEINPPPLDPCPFCGSAGTYIIGALKGRYTWHVECEKCGARIGYKPDRSKCEAAEDWNHRWRPNNHTKTAIPESPTSCLEASGPYDTPLAIDVDYDEDVGAADWR